MLCDGEVRYRPFCGDCHKFFKKIPCYFCQKSISGCVSIFRLLIKFRELLMVNIGTMWTVICNYSLVIYKGMN